MSDILEHFYAAATWRLWGPMRELYNGAADCNRANDVRDEGLIDDEQPDEGKLGSLQIHELAELAAILSALSSDTIANCELSIDAEIPDKMCISANFPGVRDQLVTGLNAYIEINSTALSKNLSQRIQKAKAALAGQ